MQLGRKQNNVDLMESLRSEVEKSTPVAQQPIQPIYSAPAEPAFPMESVHVHIEEKITMVANRDGGLENMEVKGDLMLRVSDPARTKISLALRHLDDSSIQFKVGCSSASGIHRSNPLAGAIRLTFCFLLGKTHPNVNKALFGSDKIIAFRDSSKEFPLNTPTGVLRWRFISKDEGSIPLSSKFPSTDHDNAKACRHVRSL